MHAQASLQKSPTKQERGGSALLIRLAAAAAISLASVVATLALPHQQKGAICFAEAAPASCATTAFTTPQTATFDPSESGLTVDLDRCNYTLLTFATSGAGSAAPLVAVTLRLSRLFLTGKLDFSASLNFGAGSSITILDTTSKDVNVGATLSSASSLFSIEGLNTQKSAITASLKALSGAKVRWNRIVADTTLSSAVLDMSAAVLSDGASFHLTNSVLNANPTMYRGVPIALGSAADAVESATTNIKDSTIIFDNVMSAANQYCWRVHVAGNSFFALRNSACAVRAALDTSTNLHFITESPNAIASIEPTNTFAASAGLYAHEVRGVGDGFTFVYPNNVTVFSFVLKLRASSAAASPRYVSVLFSNTRVLGTLSVESAASAGVNLGAGARIAFDNVSAASVGIGTGVRLVEAGAASFTAIETTDATKAIAVSASAGSTVTIDGWRASGKGTVYFGDCAYNAATLHIKNFISTLSNAAARCLQFGATAINGAALAPFTNRSSFIFEDSQLSSSRGDESMLCGTKASFDDTNISWRNVSFYGTAELPVGSMSTFVCRSCLFRLALKKPVEGKGLAVTSDMSASVDISHPSNVWTDSILWYALRAQLPNALHTLANLTAHSVVVSISSVSSSLTPFGIVVRDLELPGLLAITGTERSPVGLAGVSIVLERLVAAGAITISDIKGNKFSMRNGSRVVVQNVSSADGFSFDLDTFDDSSLMVTDSFFRKSSALAGTIAAGASRSSEFYLRNTSWEGGGALKMVAGDACRITAVNSRFWVSGNAVGQAPDVTIAETGRVSIDNSNRWNPSQGIYTLRITAPLLPNPRHEFSDLVLGSFTFLRELKATVPSENFTLIIRNVTAGGTVKIDADTRWDLTNSLIRVSNSRADTVDVTANINIADGSLFLAEDSVVTTKTVFRSSASSPTSLVLFNRYRTALFQQVGSTFANGAQLALIDSIFTGSLYAYTCEKCKFSASVFNVSNSSFVCPNSYNAAGLQIESSSTFESSAIYWTGVRAEANSAAVAYVDAGSTIFVRSSSFKGVVSKAALSVSLLRAVADIDASNVFTSGELIVESREAFADQAFTYENLALNGFRFVWMGRGVTDNISVTLRNVSASGTGGSFFFTSDTQRQSLVRNFSLLIANCEIADSIEFPSVANGYNFTSGSLVRIHQTRAARVAILGVRFHDSSIVVRHSTITAGSSLNTNCMDIRPVASEFVRSLVDFHNVSMTGRQAAQVLIGRDSTYRARGCFFNPTAATGDALRFTTEGGLLDLDDSNSFSLTMGAFVYVVRAPLLVGYAIAPGLKLRAFEFLRDVSYDKAPTEDTSFTVRGVSLTGDLTFTNNLKDAALSRSVFLVDYVSIGGSLKVGTSASLPVNFSQGSSLLISNTTLDGSATLFVDLHGDTALLGMVNLTSRSAAAGVSVTSRLSAAPTVSLRGIVLQNSKASSTALLRLLLNTLSTPGAARATVSIADSVFESPSSSTKDGLGLAINNELATINNLAMLRNTDIVFSNITTTSYGGAYVDVGVGSSFLSRRSRLTALNSLGSALFVRDRSALGIDVDRSNVLNGGAFQYSVCEPVVSKQYVFDGNLLPSMAKFILQQETALLSAPNDSEWRVANLVVDSLSIEPRSVSNLTVLVQNCTSTGDLILGISTTRLVGSRVNITDSSAKDLSVSAGTSEYSSVGLSGCVAQKATVGGSVGGSKMAHMCWAVLQSRFTNLVVDSAHVNTSLLIGGVAGQFAVFENTFVATNSTIRFYSNVFDGGLQHGVLLNRARSDSSLWLITNNTITSQLATLPAFMVTPYTKTPFTNTSMRWHSNRIRGSGVFNCDPYLGNGSFAEYRYNVLTATHPNYAVMCVVAPDYSDRVSFAFSTSDNTISGGYIATATSGSVALTVHNVRVASIRLSLMSSADYTADIRNVTLYDTAGFTITPSDSRNAQIHITRVTFEASSKGGLSVLDSDVKVSTNLFLTFADSSPFFFSLGPKTASVGTLLQLARLTVGDVFSIGGRHNGTSISVWNVTAKKASIALVTSTRSTHMLLESLRVPADVIEVSMDNAVNSSVILRNATAFSSVLVKGSLKAGSSVSVVGASGGSIASTVTTACDAAAPCLLEVSRSTLTAAGTALSVSGGIVGHTVVYLERNVLTTSTTPNVPSLLIAGVASAAAVVSVIQNTVTNSLASGASLSVASDAAIGGALEVWGNALAGGSGASIYLAGLTRTALIVQNRFSAVAINGVPPQSEVDAPGRIVACATLTDGTAISSSAIDSSLRVGEVACSASSPHIGRCGGAAVPYAAFMQRPTEAVTSGGPALATVLERCGGTALFPAASDGATAIVNAAVGELWLTRSPWRVGTGVDIEDDGHWHCFPRPQTPTPSVSHSVSQSLDQLQTLTNVVPRTPTIPEALPSTTEATTTETSTTTTTEAVTSEAPTTTTTTESSTATTTESTTTETSTTATTEVTTTEAVTTEGPTTTTTTESSTATTTEATTAEPSTVTSETPTTTAATETTEASTTEATTTVTTATDTTAYSTVVSETSTTSTATTEASTTATTEAPSSTETTTAPTTEAPMSETNTTFTTTEAITETSTVTSEIQTTTATTETTETPTAETSSTASTAAPTTETAAPTETNSTASTEAPTTETTAPTETNSTASTEASTTETTAPTETNSTASTEAPTTETTAPTESETAPIVVPLTVRLSTSAVQRFLDALEGGDESAGGANASLAIEFELPNPSTIAGVPPLPTTPQPGSGGATEFAYAYRVDQQSSSEALWTTSLSNGTDVPHSEASHAVGGTPVCSLSAAPPPLEEETTEEESTPEAPFALLTCRVGRGSAIASLLRSLGAANASSSGANRLFSAADSAEADSLAAAAVVSAISVAHPAALHLLAVSGGSGASGTSTSRTSLVLSGRADIGDVPTAAPTPTPTDGGGGAAGNDREAAFAFAAANQRDDSSFLFLSDPFSLEAQLATASLRGPCGGAADWSFARAAVYILSPISELMLVGRGDDAGNALSSGDRADAHATAAVAYAVVGIALVSLHATAAAAHAQWSKKRRGGEASFAVSAAAMRFPSLSTAGGFVLLVPSLFDAAMAARHRSASPSSSASALPYAAVALVALHSLVVAASALLSIRLVRCVTHSADAQKAASTPPPPFCWTAPTKGRAARRKEGGSAAAGADIDDAVLGPPASNPNTSPAPASRGLALSLVSFFSPRGVWESHEQRWFAGARLFTVGPTSGQQQQYSYRQPSNPSAAAAEGNTPAQGFCNSFTAAVAQSLSVTAAVFAVVVCFGLLTPAPNNSSCRDRLIAAACVAFAAAAVVAIARPFITLFAGAATSVCLAALGALWVLQAVDAADGFARYSNDDKKSSGDGDGHARLMGGLKVAFLMVLWVASWARSLHLCVYAVSLFVRSPKKKATADDDGGSLRVVSPDRGGARGLACGPRNNALFCPTRADFIDVDTAAREAEQRLSSSSSDDDDDDDLFNSSGSSLSDEEGVVSKIRRQGNEGGGRGRGKSSIDRGVIKNANTSRSEDAVEMVELSAHAPDGYSHSQHGSSRNRSSAEALSRGSGAPPPPPLRGLPSEDGDAFAHRVGAAYRSVDSISSSADVSLVEMRKFPEAEQRRDGASSLTPAAAGASNAMEVPLLFGSAAARGRGEGGIHSRRSSSSSSSSSSSLFGDLAVGGRGTTERPASASALPHAGPAAARRYGSASTLSDTCSFSSAGADVRSFVGSSDSDEGEDGDKSDSLALMSLPSSDDLSDGNRLEDETMLF